MYIVTNIAGFLEERMGTIKRCLQVERRELKCYDSVKLPSLPADMTDHDEDHPATTRQDIVYSSLSHNVPVSPQIKGLSWIFTP